MKEDKKNKNYFHKEGFKVVSRKINKKPAEVVVQNFKVHKKLNKKDKENFGDAFNNSFFNSPFHL